MNPISVSLAVEGQLDELVLRRLVSDSGRAFTVRACYGKRGKDHLRQNVPRFNTAAVHHPFVVLTDLDDEDCAPGLVARWLPRGRHANLILRIAVREVEAWLLADAERFAEFLGVRRERMPPWPDQAPNPKELVVALARQSRKRNIREEIVPSLGSTSKVGKNYVGQLMGFVTDHWRVDAALQRSPSLARALHALQQFNPLLPQNN